MAARVALAALLVALAACGGGAGRVRPGPGGPEPAQPPAPTMKSHFIDVGQGDATLLEFPCAAMLIDTGGELDEGFDGVAALRDYLDAFFARRADLHNTLELVVVSHPHVDHTRGLPMVLGRYQVRHVIDNGQVRSTGVADVTFLHAWLGQHPEVGHEDIHADQMTPGGLSDDVIDPIACPEVDPQIRVLWGQSMSDPGWPADSYGRLPFDNENNHSVVVRVDFGRSSFLFPGDLEEAGIGALVHAYAPTHLLDVDVYKVGHHGSRNGTTAAEVAAMTPRLAVISMGPSTRHWDWTAWRYGHPSKRVLELLERGLSDKRAHTEVLVGERGQTFTAFTLDAAVYATGWDGTVVVGADTRGRIRVERPAR
jgi:competence protein ComEC